MKIIKIKNIKVFKSNDEMRHDKNLKKGEAYIVTHKDHRVKHENPEDLRPLFHAQVMIKLK